MTATTPEARRREEIAKLTWTLANARVPAAHAAAMNGRHWAVIATISEIPTVPSSDVRAAVVERLRAMEIEAMEVIQ